MPEWIEVDPTTLVTEKKSTIRGVEVELIVSPYDVPEAVRGHYDESKKRFVIEFKYIGDEGTKKHTHDKNLTYRVGESSGRLHALEIDVDALKADSVALNVKLIEEVNEAFDHLLEKPISALRADNYRLAKDAVVAKQRELLEAFA
jgi:hypothetical protein